MSKENPKKKELINFMHTAGFDWICDVAYVAGQELVASNMADPTFQWWRPLRTEGSGFTQLFEGSIRRIYE